MTEYHKIDTMFKRESTGRHRIILGEWSCPEFAYLSHNRWVFTEKVDGTNIRVNWDGVEIAYGGRTDNASIPVRLIARLNELVHAEMLREVFPDGGVTLYGEGYGAKIQKSGGNYSPGQEFVLFDVKCGELWLSRENVEDVARKLGLRWVPEVGQGTLTDAVQYVRSRPPSRWGDFTAEGIVARPFVELCTRRGQRIITKLKVRDFEQIAEVPQ